MWERWGLMRKEGEVGNEGEKKKLRERWGICLKDWGSRDNQRYMGTRSYLLWKPRDMCNPSI